MSDCILLLESRRVIPYTVNSRTMSRHFSTPLALGSEISSDNETIEILRENMIKIKHSFSKLASKVIKRLELRSRSGDIDMRRFRCYIIQMFGDIINIDDASSMYDIMAAVSRHQLWDYSCYTPIANIAEEFGGDDGELREWISSYKSELSGFKATTKIVDYIKVCNEEQEFADSTQSIKEDMTRFNYRTLTIKLKSRVLEKSLDYIDQLWMSIADHFLLPSLTALLDRIQEGCVEVTWLVPLQIALQIKDGIQNSAEFLKQLGMVKVVVDNTILYGVKQKVSILYYSQGFIKGVSTRRRRGEGMQLSYILYRGQNAGGY